MDASFLARAVILICSFAVSFWALGALNYEKYLKANHVLQAQVLYWLLSFALAWMVSQFLISLMYRI